MPTFQSIGIHPELRSRLVTISSVQESEDSGQQRPPQPVETPQALLSRNPAQLRLLNRETGTSKPISSLQVRKLRDEVAHALISQSQNGKRVKRLRQVVQQGIGHAAEGNDTRIASSLTIEGFASALDLVRYETLHTGGPLPTGCPSLDAMLALPTEYAAVVSTAVKALPVESAAVLPTTGLPRGYVTQLAGPPASGKSQVALHLAAQQALTTTTASTWYLCNASAAIYAQRLAQLIPSGATRALDRTIFRTVTDEYQVLAALADLRAVLENEEDDAGEENAAQTNAARQQVSKPLLLVLDSASGCLCTENDDLMAKVALSLKSLARQHGLAVLVTNGAVTDRSSDSISSRSSKAALGKAWKSAADIHVWLESIGRSSGNAAAVVGGPSPKFVQARLDRHPAKRCFAKDEDPIVCTFEITATGLKETSSNACQ